MKKCVLIQKKIFPAFKGKTMNKIGEKRTWYDPLFSPQGTFEDNRFTVERRQCDICRDKVIFHTKFLVTDHRKE